MKGIRLLGLACFTVVWLGCSRAELADVSLDSPADTSTPPSRKDTSAETLTTPGGPPSEPRRSTSDLPQPVTLSEDDWPQYRGRRRDGISLAVGLRRTWPDEGPPVVWEMPVGQGYAAPSVVAGRVYLNDYDEPQGEWMVRCLALDSGKEQWRYKIKKRIRPNHSITRSAPATDGGFVFAIDPKCELHCLDARDGSLIWKKFLPAEYGSQIPAWYNGQCPLIDGDRLVIATGGRALMTALKKGTGDPIWETENPDAFRLTHSSVMPVEIEGVRQYTYTTFEGLVGVEAESGKLLWHFPWKFHTAVASTPLPLDDGRFFLTAGYHAETVVCQIRQEDGNWMADEVYRLPPPTQGWNSEVHTPIFFRGHIFGIGKKKRGLWTCLDLEGNEVWTSAGHASFGMGGYALADGMFFVLEGKSGVLRVLDANADQYRELANFKLLEGPDVWAPPVVSMGKLLIRDLNKLICLDIAGDNASVASIVNRDPPPVSNEE